jgi:hypothetical protein
VTWALSIPGSSGVATSFLKKVQPSPQISRRILLKESMNDDIGKILECRLYLGCTAGHTYLTASKAGILLSLLPDMFLAVG